MKNKSTTKTKAKRATDLRAEYHFDYAKAKPNRFAERAQPRETAELELRRIDLAASWPATGYRTRDITVRKMWLIRVE